MAKRARSARGEVVDFDLIAIRQQLASAPTSVEVSTRREYIDSKDGIKAPVKDAIATPISVTGDSEGSDQFEQDLGE